MRTRLLFAAALMLALVVPPAAAHHAHASTVPTVTPAPSVWYGLPGEFPPTDVYGWAGTGNYRLFSIDPDEIERDRAACRARRLSVVDPTALCVATTPIRYRVTIERS